MKELGNVREVGFTVDAGLIQRLGYELVGRAETAVSELIKNSYDADATIVDVDFIDSYQQGGTLVISDNGNGMTEDQLVNGFMRISSTEKVHNPVSPRFKRTKAGRKGIGRFATQRLGEILTIITQCENFDYAIKITIDWRLYSIDTDLSSVKFPISYIEKKEKTGTILTISNLRDKWTDAALSRIYRYVLELFQPNYLSERSRINNYAIQDESTFKVNFNQIVNQEKTPILNEQISLFDKSLAVFKGEINNEHNGTVSVKSDCLGIDDLINIEYSKEQKEFLALSNVYFKMYYFIYGRPDYYQGKISNIDLNKIKELSQTASGVRLYRNGFRVLPYGESSNDWIHIERRWSSESGKANVPLSNKNLFGFVEIVDPAGEVFEETSSREGLIENEAFSQLSDFVFKALSAVRGRIVEKITILRSQYNKNDDFTQENNEREQTTQDMLDSLKMILKNQNSEDSNSDTERQLKEKNVKRGNEIIQQLEYLIEETGMLRVLAGLGLTIGEFTHEIKQFQPSVYGHISKLNQLELNKDVQLHVDSLKMDFDNLFGYTKYFSTTISQNTNRKKEPVDVLAVIDAFYNTIKNDLTTNDIDFDVEEYDYDVITIPMHKSEWSSILYNLYTNARKAIKRANRLGKILVEVGVDLDNVILKFHDNGDGIPEENKDRIFNPFFSTSTPASFDAPNDEQLVGTGLGLKIVKDIIQSYKGFVSLTSPQTNYSTCFKIVIPKNK